MRKFLALPGLFDMYAHDTLDEARESAKALGRTSENAVVAEVVYTYERSDSVVELPQGIEEAETAQRDMSENSNCARCGFPKSEHRVGYSRSRCQFDVIPTSPGE